MRSKSRLGRLIWSPYRALVKAKEMYVSTVTSCAGKLNYPSGVNHELPRSYSTRSCSSEGDDFRELVRVASVRTMSKHETSHQSVKRSSSVGMGRIDEDAACFDGDEQQCNAIGKERLDLFYPRSRSYAPASGRVGFI